jgi:hypothetical protein
MNRQWDQALIDEGREPPRFQTLEISPIRCPDPSQSALTGNRGGEQDVPSPVACRQRSLEKPDDISGRGEGTGRRQAIGQDTEGKDLISPFQLVGDSSRNVRDSQPGAAIIVELPKQIIDQEQPALGVQSIIRFGHVRGNEGQRHAVAFDKGGEFADAQYDIARRVGNKRKVLSDPLEPFQGQIPLEA